MATGQTICTVYLVSL